MTIAGDPSQLAADVLRQRVRYLNKYGDEIARLVATLSKVGHSQVASLLTQDLTRLRRETGRVTDMASEEQTKVLHRMLETIGSMRTTVSKAKRDALGEL